MQEDLDMKISTVALIGPGAIGSYFIWSLAPFLKENFIVIAEGKRKERLEKNGISINGEIFHPTVKSVKEVGTVDLVIASVKYGNLKDILPDIASLTGKNTIVFSPMNGVNSEEIIGDKIGKDHIIHSLIRIPSHRTAQKDGPDEIKFTIPTGIMGLYIGKAEQLESSCNQIEALRNLFDQSKIHYHISQTIVSDIWSKFYLNIGQNIPQAIVGCGAGAYEDSEHVRWIRSQLQSELKLIASAKSISLNQDIIQNKIKSNKSLINPSARHSTLQDLDAHRHTEIDMLCGYISEQGKQLNIPTPYNDFAYHVIKALEEKNDGKFDY